MNIVLEATMDPHSQHNLSDSDALAWCGMIPMWVVEAISGLEDPRLDTMGEAITESVLNSYSFPVTDSLAMEPRAEVKEDGVYLYPEDPPLYPLATLKHPSITIHIYPFGMVAFAYGGTTKVYRLD